MKKILTVVGARPQFIKAATVSRAIRATSGLHEILVHTGQHFDANMSEVFFDELEIPRPDHHLGINGGNHGNMTGRMLAGIEEIILQEEPDWVMVYGDTNSTLAGALAAVKLHVPVAHVEAGLRSYNCRMPEEVNRVLTDHASNLLFAPTESAVANLLREGIREHSIRRVGDVMFDAALFYSQHASGDLVQSLGLSTGSYLLATLHRAENTDDPSRLANLLRTLNAASSLLPVVLPLHPRTRAAMERIKGIPAMSSNVRLIEPVSYLDMVLLEKHAKVIATDSGGVQKEAYFHHVPCITLRDETEWVELVEHGWNKLVGANKDSFFEALSSILKAPSLPVWLPGLYGDGNSAKEIIAQIMRDSSMPMEATK